MGAHSQPQRPSRTKWARAGRRQRKLRASCPREGPEAPLSSTALVNEIVGDLARLVYTALRPDGATDKLREGDGDGRKNRDGDSGERVWLAIRARPAARCTSCGDSMCPAGGPE